MLPLGFLGATLVLCHGVSSLGIRDSPPRATLKNGTYEGLHVSSYNQDLFLGIPYAQPPVGDLRLRNPLSLNESFDVKQAVEYAPSCYGYGNSDAWPYVLSEDCLTLNVIRPAGQQNGSKLPVAVWIHGGGYVMDYSANGVYNLSFIVQKSVEIQKPMIAVSLDYRLSAWGFLASDEILSHGVANLGLKDQYLALRFIKENIAAFGGDPEKITIWGETYGRDDGLFRGVIAESAFEPSHANNLTLPNERYANLSAAVGCSDASDTLDCLRKVPTDVLDSAIAKIVPTTSFYPVLLAQGTFAKVPLLIGSNSDEGTTFSPSGINTDEDFTQSVLSDGPDENNTAIISSLYPDIPSVGIPVSYHAWYNHGVPSYAFQFDSLLPNSPAYLGTGHFQEIAYVFYNIEGEGYESDQVPFKDATEGMLKLADLMSRMWISFVVDQDPNNHGISDIPEWPVYNNSLGYASEFYFNTESPRAQLDNYRLEGTTFINAIQETQYGR
ncbi:Alpha/Beta hydrolase protein [Camillea tinctor]|nr:Alpha/Beta hydrolase protein [Camillea tinctor]